jgi:hypothetical protein
MESSFKRYWGIKMTNLFHYYDSPFKCAQHIDILVEKLFAEFTPMGMSFSKRWLSTNRNSWNDIQKYLTDSRSALQSKEYFNNLSAQKLLLIEHFVYVSDESNEFEVMRDYKTTEWKDKISASVLRNKTQHPKSFFEWDALTRSFTIFENTLIFFISECISWGDKTLQSTMEEIEEDALKRNEFITRRNFGVGSAIKTDEHANKLRIRIMDIGFDTMMTLEKR